MRNELITWHDLPADGHPTNDDTVLVEVAGIADSPRIFPLFWDGMYWIDVSGGYRLNERYRPVAWAAMPIGTRA